MGAKAKEWERYYLSTSLEIDYNIEANDEIDNSFYNYWNYYRTEEEAEKARDKQLAIVRVNDRIDELNEWWLHDTISTEAKYYICSYWSEYIIDACFYEGYSFNFKYMKTRKIAQQIIDEMKDDLDLIFNI